MYRPINEQDEFLLSRLLDDDLSAEEATALRARMEREPELRGAFATMTRIDSLLTARRADQPRVDWSRFHREVMNKVEAEAARPITIRLAKYLRVALPLAAAAAIGLVVWFRPHGGSGLPQPKEKQTGIEIARVDQPVPPSTSVIYHHPESTGADDVIRVSFARSDELSKEYQAEDEKSRDRGTFLVDKNRPAQSSSPGLLAEALTSFY